MEASERLVGFASLHLPFIFSQSWSDSFAFKVHSFGLNHYGTRWATGLKYDTQAKLRDDATLQDKFEFFCGNIEVTPRGKDGTMIGNEGNLAQVYDGKLGRCYT
jgi:hypothetical protein